jgi:glucose/arabinose dehydrogenase
MLRRGVAALAVLLLLTSAGLAAQLPEGFADRQVAAGITGATAMAFAPDGRLFICQQDGRLRIVKNGVLLPEPFLTVATDPTGERGLLGVAFDPDFTTNGFVYVYYTVPEATRHNRVSRFTADGDRAVPGSETLIFRLDNLGSATSHNGGAMHFGPDGKLYVAVGENAVASNAQTLGNLHGKMLRINRDGSIPTDNPFFTTATGNRRAIWALGLRNPFTFAFEPGSTRLYINDVGDAIWEEINEGAPGANYGWPASSGPTNDPAHTGPIFAYPHGSGPESGCAITGGAFYNPSTAQFPSSFVGKYFFADFCGGWIRVLDPQQRTTSGFATGISFPVDLKVAPDGSLYYLARGNDSVHQVFYTGPGSPPIITEQPLSRMVSAGSSVTFACGSGGAQPLTFRWRRDGVEVAAANSETLTLPAVTVADDGARFACVVTNAFGSATSAEAVLRVTGNRPPTARIDAPAEATLYTAGETISYAGAGEDPDQGTLPPSAFTWQVDFHHAAHVHPFIPPTTGASAGSFVIPTDGEKSPDVWYRIRLKVTDAGGLTHETFRDVRPRLARVTLRTEPAGLQVVLDGQTFTAPHEFVGVAGIVRRLSTLERHLLNGQAYVFQRWSDGGAREHDAPTPATDTTITAFFAPAIEPAPNSIRLSAQSYTASEGDGRAVVTILREGDLSSAASVEFATNDNTASERTDYVPALRTIRFAPNESSKTIEVILTGGTVVEETETFTVTLSNAVGLSALMAPATATIFVLDDDAAPPPPGNPIDDARFFVTQHYHDFLGREPDEDGLRFWSDLIINCGSDAPCVERTRVQVSAAFFLSIEFQETSYLVYRLYVASFGRFPRFREMLRDAHALGSGVVVGRGEWRAQLEANRRAFLEEFVARPEFIAVFPADLAPAEFVARLVARTGTAISQEERDSIVARLGTGELTRAAALSEVVDDADFRRAEFNRAFVLIEYFGYLRRNPDDSPDSDFSGWQFWLDNLERFGGNYERAEMVKAFISSIEYRRRFAP